MFASLSLFPATLEQAIESRKRSYVTWGTASNWPYEDYIDKPNTMGGLEAAAEGRFTTW